MSTNVLLTIGHSTWPASHFVELLKTHGVNGVADVRRFPGSRRHPQYSSGALAKLLVASEIAYLHLAELGGRRQPGAHSSNTAWQNPSFRAYADYMATDAFRSGIEALLTFAKTRHVAIMCAEAQWWRCHRQLVADALVARGIEVRHIMSKTSAPVHQLTPFARVHGLQVSYPGVVGPF